MADQDEDSVQSALRQIDSQLVDLLQQRIELLSEAPPSLSASQQSSSTRFPSNSAAENLEHRLAAVVAKTNLPAGLVQDWLRHAQSLCDRARRPQAIAYLGPIYSYSYLAAVKHFGIAANLVPVATITAAFEEVTRGQSDFAVVPIENSTDGRVVDTLGSFAKLPVEICGEVLLPVHHCLLGKGARDEVVEVQSKPQALSQCRTWLAQHVPHARLVEVASTAVAAANAATDHGVAAIASHEAGIHHGLQLIDENIEDNQHNVTRFAVIGNQRHSPTGSDKSSLMFQLQHQPGALADAMVAFQKSDVNLTWIESFPLQDAPNEYLFFVELEGHRESENVATAIEALRSLALRIELLGSYPRGV